MIKEIFRKILTLYKRRNNAGKLGVQFSRASKWILPNEIIINKILIKLKLIDDNSTKTAFMDIFLDDCYGLNFFKQHLKQVNTIIDVGANQGIFTLYARNIFPDASIHAYEPNQSIITNLSHHAEKTKTIYFNEAVGLNSGRIILETGMDSLHGKTTQNEFGDIKQISIKECFDRLSDIIDILKLDCEGAEWEILKDTESIIRVKAITLEYHLDSFHDHRSILKVLQSNDFRILHYSIDGPTWGIVWAFNNRFDNRYA